MKKKDLIPFIDHLKATLKQSIKDDAIITVTETKGIDTFLRRECLIISIKIVKGVD